MRVTFIYKRFTHHARPSGYDRLVDFIPNQKIAHCWLAVGKWLARRISDQSLARLTDDIHGGWYLGREKPAREIAVGLSMAVRPGVYHFLYGENDFRWAGLFPRRPGARLLVSFHQPPKLFAKIFPKPKAVAQADAIIVLGKNQVEYFRALSGKDNVFLIPHGVDRNFWRPPKVEEAPMRKRKSFLCLCVGSWLRDFETLYKAAATCEKKMPWTRFVLVSPGKAGENFRSLKNTRVVAGVSDAALRWLYWQADALVLPLLDATANNSILEAMACALYVISTRTGGVADYVVKDCGALVKPGRADEVLEHIAWRCELQSFRKSAGSCQHVSAFDWPAIAAKHLALYKNIF